MYNDCKLRYVDVSDNKFRVESHNGDLVVADDFCSTLDPMSIIVMISYECDVNSEIVSPSEHYIKVSGENIFYNKTLLCDLIKKILDDTLAQKKFNRNWTSTKRS